MNKTVVGFSESGRKKVIDFLKEYDKFFESPQYNLDYVIGEALYSAFERDSYKIDAFSSRDGLPKILNFFKKEHFVFYISES